MIRQPTEHQIGAAKRLGIPHEGMTFRAISAYIGDEFDRRSDEYVKKHGLVSGMAVRYIGPKEYFPKRLVISSYGKNCCLYFKGGSEFYCRPWDVVPAKTKKIANQGAAANRRPAGQSDGSDDLAATVAADLPLPAAVAELDR